jgi:hypothetical protein
MNKLLVISVSALLLSACADKKQYEQAVLEDMKKEKDIQDYKIDPEYMAKCVVDTTANNMPGLFEFDPKRMTAYRNYAKMLTLSKSDDPKKTMEDLRKEFGGPKEFSDAHSNYTESYMACYTAVLAETETPVKDKNPKQP